MVLAQLECPLGGIRDEASGAVYASQALQREPLSQWGPDGAGVPLGMHRAKEEGPVLNDRPANGESKVVFRFIGDGCPTV